MPIENWSDRVLVARLGDDPQFSEDLDSLEDAVKAGGVDAVLDFSGVRFVSSSNLARLLKLRRHMIGAERRLVMCAVGEQVWGAFLLTNLDKLFQFADNVALALATLQMQQPAKGESSS